MGVLKNGVGRPSNETIKKRNILKIVCVILVLIIIGLICYILNDKGIIKMNNNNKEERVIKKEKTTNKRNTEEVSEDSNDKMLPGALNESGSIPLYVKEKDKTLYYAVDGINSTSEKIEKLKYKGKEIKVKMIVQTEFDGDVIKYLSYIVNDKNEVLKLELTGKNSEDTEGTLSEVKLYKKGFVKYEDNSTEDLVNLKFIYEDGSSEDIFDVSAFQEYK